MKLRHHDLHIPKDGSDPFVNCKLDRKIYADILTDIVSGYANGFVLAINNPWGEGKTTFVKMWRQHLENEQFKTLYFNAWENDFEKDVMVALISELAEIKNKPVDTFNKVLDKAVSLTNKVLPAMAKHLAKKVIGDEAAEAIIEGVAEYGAEELKKQINSYNSRKKSIQDFKDNLEVFVSEVDAEKPVVFIIDELDRCRPNYAVEVLEEIKHLFSVPGIVFVLSIDKEQLGHAVRGVYGSDNINADEYLRRFIDLEYSIPSPIIKRFSEYLFGYFGFDEFYDDIRNNSSGGLKHEKTNFLGVYESLFKNIEISLRGHEKLFSRIRIIVKSYSKDQYTFLDIIALFLYFKVYHKALYKDIVNKKHSPQKLLDEIGSLFTGLREDQDKNSITFAIARLVYMYCNYLKYGGAREIYKYDEDSKENIFLLKFDFNQQKLESAFNSFRMDYNIDAIGLDWLINRIELTEKLQS